MAPSKLLYVSVNWEAQFSGLRGLHATTFHLAWQKDVNTLRPILSCFSPYTGGTEETLASLALPQSAVLHRKWETHLVCSSVNALCEIFLTFEQAASVFVLLSGIFFLTPPPLPLFFFFLLLFFGTSERKARHLYYSDLRERVLRSECRQQEEVYFQLAGYAMQADLGDHPPLREDMPITPYFEPKQYFPPWVGVTLLQQHQITLWFLL